MREKDQKVAAHGEDALRLGEHGQKHQHKCRAIARRGIPGPARARRAGKGASPPARSSWWSAQGLGSGSAALSAFQARPIAPQFLTRSLALAYLAESRCSSARKTIALPPARRDASSISKCSPSRRAGSGRCRRFISKLPRIRARTFSQCERPWAAMKHSPPGEKFVLSAYLLLVRSISASTHCYSLLDFLLTLLTDTFYEGPCL